MLNGAGQVTLPAPQVVRSHEQHARSVYLKVNSKGDNKCESLFMANKMEKAVLKESRELQN